jgi:hypothetical protein
MCRDLQALVDRAAMRLREGDLREMRRTCWLQNKKLLALTLLSALSHILPRGAGIGQNRVISIGSP